MMTTELGKILDFSFLEKEINESLKPDTIMNIQKKYNLDFPFKVKRVKQTPDKVYTLQVGETALITGIEPCHPSSIGKGKFTVKDSEKFIPSENTYYSLSADAFKDYILVE